MIAPRLRLVFDVELEGPVTFSVVWTHADTYATRKRLWWWMLGRRGFRSGLEEMLADAKLDALTADA